MRWRLLAAMALALGASGAAAQSPIPNDPFLSVPAPASRPVPRPPQAAPRPAQAPAASFPVGIGQSFRDCPDCPEMVVIPAGSFVMGSPEGEVGAGDEGPRRSVRVSAPLAVGRFHVTVGEYRSFVSATGRPDGGSCFVWTGSQSQDTPGRNWRSPGFAQSDRDPVVCASWEDSQAYAGWLSGRTGRGYRLLTEAQWEYAARAGTQTRWWWGDDEAAQCRHANGGDAATRSGVPGASNWTVASCNDGFAYTSPVGRFLANRFGLHDMGGNGWQWVQDCYGNNYRGAPADASRAVTTGGCSARVLRGGSWGSTPQVLRAAHRYGVAPGIRDLDIGFRLARTPG